MQKLIIATLAAAAISGCAAGQVFGPTLRTGCQAEEQLSGKVIDNLTAASIAAGEGARKEALKACGRKMRAAEDSCEAVPSVAAAAAMTKARENCSTLLLGGGQ